MTESLFLQFDYSSTAFVSLSMFFRNSMDSVYTVLATVSMKLTAIIIDKLNVPQKPMIAVSCANSIRFI
jgi:hypothetical protein